MDEFGDDPEALMKFLFVLPLCAYLLGKVWSEPHIGGATADPPAPTLTWLNF